MAVYIHPKDSGPIDTSKREYCDNCETGIRRKGSYYYSKDVRQSDRKQKYRNVCPHCKEAQNAVRVKTLQCGKCHTYFSQMDIKTVSRKEPLYQCPCCKETVSEDRITIVD